MTPDDVLYPADVAAKLKLDEATTMESKLKLRADPRIFVRERSTTTDMSPAKLRHSAILAQLARAWARAPHLPLGQVVEDIAAHAGTDVGRMTDDQLFLTARTWPQIAGR